MVVYNYSGKEINAKIVYYGPALSGKTTNLEWIYSKIPVEYSGKMVSLRTQADRTIFFDFLPLDLGMIDGFRTRFMLYTVPGQVHYNATRKMVLKGVDGLVFVADSEPGRMQDNLESLQNLRDNLQELGLDPDSLPLAMQWNKRDLPHCMPVAEMEAELNPRHLASFEACALTGEGVYETLHKICRLIYTKLTGQPMGMHSDADDSSAEASLFGEPIAERLREVDIPKPEPARVRLESSKLRVPEMVRVGGSAPREDVMDTILGGRSASGPRSAEAPEPAASPPNAALNPNDARASAHERRDHWGGAKPGRPASTPADEISSRPGGRDDPRPSGSRRPVDPRRTGPQAREDGLMSELVDEVLHRLDESEASARPGRAEAERAARPRVVAAERAERAERTEDDMTYPKIEHDIDVFPHGDPSHAAPGGPQSSRPRAVPHEIDLDRVSGPASPAEAAVSSQERDFDLITDPRRLPGDRSSAAGGLGSGSFGSPAANAKILEVPVTLDASALEEGKQIRIVLSLTVKR